MCNGQCPYGTSPSAPARALPMMDRLVGRRDFVTQSLLAAVATVLAGSTLGCGLDLMKGPNVPTLASLGSGLTVDPATFPTLANVGGIARVDSQQRGVVPVALVRTGTNSWAAFSMVCPHQGTTINIISGGFRCPNHGAQFNTSGSNIGGQPTGPLTSLPVTVQTNGTLVIGGGNSSTGQQPAGGSGDGPYDD